jgi:predicted nucleic acid-binding protein
LADTVIDVGRLPQRALFDTGVVIRALGERPEDPRSRFCEALWEAMVENGREILIAAPSIAEMIRQDGKGAIPHRRGVEVVGFDARAAEFLGRKFPERVLALERGSSGLPKYYIKYDAMIVACAVRHRATHLVGLDEPLTTFARAAGLKASRPEDFADPQLNLVK